MMVPSARPPLVIFSPLPPQRNGIADYTAELAPYYGRDYTCMFVVADEAPAIAPLPNARILRLSEYLAHERSFETVPHLYQIGNNPDHIYMISVLLRRPGILVLHDLSLHYLFDRASLGYGYRAGYRDLLIRDLGPAGRCLWEQFDRFGWREPLVFYTVRLNQHLIARSQAVIVHSAYNRIKVEATRGAPPVFRVPHHVALDPSPMTPTARAELRRFLGIPPTHLLLLSLGFITRAKQTSLTLQVLAQLRDSLPPFVYLLGGEPDDHFDVQGEINRLGLADVCRVTGYLAEETFFRYLSIADIVLNLRHPTGGETSGTLLRALGSGACVVVNEVGAFGEFPDRCLVKVPWNARADQALGAALRMLMTEPERRAAYGRAGQAYVLAHHGQERTAEGYRQAIEAARLRPALPWAITGAWEYRPPARSVDLAPEPQSPDLAPETGALWWREAVMPVATSAEPARAVGLCARDPAVRGLLEREFGFTQVRSVLDAGSGEPPPPRSLPPRSLPPRSLPPRSLDALLIVAGRTELPGTLRDVLIAANALLKFGGVLVVDVWEDRPGDADDDFPICAEDIDSVMLSTGWQVTRHVEGESVARMVRRVEDVAWWRLNRPAEWCCRAVKISEYTARPVSLGPPLTFPAVPEVVSGISSHLKRPGADQE